MTSPRALPAIGLLLAAAAACGGDGSSPTCGFAQVAGPRLILGSFLERPEAVIAEPPRGLPAGIPTRAVGHPSGTTEVTYGADGLIEVAFNGAGFPHTDSSFALLVVDDSTSRVEGILVYDVPVPPSIRRLRLGAVTSGGISIPLFGVRVIYANVSNPRCPLFAPPPQPAPS